MDTNLIDFMIRVNGVDCDNEQMPLTQFLSVNDYSLPVGDIVEILSLKIGETWQCPGYAPGCDFTVTRLDDLDTTKPNGYISKVK